MSVQVVHVCVCVRVYVHVLKVVCWNKNGKIRNTDINYDLIQVQLNVHVYVRVHVQVHVPVWTLPNLFQGTTFNAYFALLNRQVIAEIQTMKILSLLAHNFQRS